MLTLKDELSVYIWTTACDMRCGFDRLAALVEERMCRQVVSGGVYVFFSRRRDRVKLLWWNRDGYAIYFKRLEAGTFKVGWQDGHEVVSGVDLKLLLSGMDLERIKFRKKAEKGLYSAAPYDQKME